MNASDLPPIFVRVFAFLFGSLWGSFFNVAIYRWPRFLSVVTPPSHCPACKKAIPFYRNVPILGFVFLRGKAACCGAPMSPRYVVVEALSGLLCLAVAERFFVAAPEGTTLSAAMIETVLYFFFVGGLLVASFVDLEWMEIPDEVWLPGTALGLVTVTFRTSPGAVDAAIGAGAAFLAVELVFVWGYERLTGRRGMGGGDPKLLMMIGAFLGWQGALFALVAGAFQGVLAAVIALSTGQSITPEPPKGERDEGEDDEDDEGEPEPPADAPGRIKVPFGPFLALGALEFLFGDRIVNAYFDLIGVE